MEFAPRCGHYKPPPRAEPRPAFENHAGANTLKSNAKVATPRGGAIGPAVRLATWLLAGMLTTAMAACTGLRDAAPAPSPAPKPRTDPSAAEPSRAEAAEPPAAPTRPKLPPDEAAEVERLLASAERAIELDHLSYPSEGSALALYDRVMILDPGNDEARRGLERVVERYLEMALTYSEQRRFPQADAMLDRARLVDPAHPGIGPTQAQIRMLNDADRRVINLDGNRLRDQDPALAETLRQAGVASRGAGCRAQITARSDSEGRWIYQQMSEGPGDIRIRAQLDIGSPPQVEVLCFPEAP
jgi:hypothetical protein